MKLWLITRVNWWSLQFLSISDSLCQVFHLRIEIFCRRIMTIADLMEKKSREQARHQKSEEKENIMQNHFR